jgi:acetyl esterase/lipase
MILRRTGKLLSIAVGDDRMFDPFRFGPWVSDAAMGLFAQETGAPPPSSDNILDLRLHYDAYNERHLAEAVAIDPVRITERAIGGVPTHVVEPANGVRDSRRLICLHGGAFMWGSGPGALLEAVPVAAVTGMQVLSVDYRLAPEHVFPAAVEDVIAVYREMIAEQDAREIGIFGCSAGAVLTAEAVSRMLHDQLPVPGAIAMLHGAGLDFQGDSAQTALALQAAPASGSAPSFETLPYFSGVDPNDPLAAPGNHPGLLAGFPPSVLVTASRDFAASAVWVMHRRLLAAGVDAECVTFDGLWHAHHMSTGLPESRETFEAMARFFGARLRTA